MKPLRILIADDHDIVREGLRSLLSAQPGWEVCGEAANGREAVAQARQLGPDVAILDFSMPELNGLDAARQIRKSLPHTEVLILTMHDLEELAREIFAAGAGSYILKTDAKRHLVEAIKALAQHQPYFTSTIAARVLSGSLALGAKTTKTRRPRDQLTPREHEIVQLIVEGKSNKEIAALLGRSVKTVDAHRANLMLKLRLRSVTELVRYAIRNKIVEA